MFTRWGTWLALVLGSALLAVLPVRAADAVVTCDPSDPNVYRWSGGQTDHDWMNPANWEHGPTDLPGAPNDNKSLSDPWQPGVGGDTSNTIACISIPPGQSDFTELDNSTTAFVWLQELHINGNFTVHLKPENTGLLVMGGATSTLGSGVVIDAQGTFGGFARIESSGSVQLRSNPSFPAHLSSEIILGNTYSGSHGLLVVEPTGTLELARSGVGLTYSYGVELHGTAIMSDGYLAAGWGTSFTIGADGLFDIRNDGGYYQGFQAGQPAPSALANGGRIVKSGGVGTSVIDATYTETGAGQIEVQSGTVAQPGGTVHQAKVSPSRSLSTSKCAARAAEAACDVTVDPLQDPQSVTLTVPTVDLDGALVVVREDPALATTVDAKGVGHVLTAHADGLAATTADPAVIEVRIGKSEAGTVNPDQLSVVREADDGSTSVLPTCQVSGLPPSGTSCVDRRGSSTSSRAAGANMLMVVRTTTTSRWIIRKEDADTISPAVLAPAAGAKTKLGKSVSVTTTFTEACTVTATGNVKTKKVKVKGLKLTADPVTAAAGQQVTLVLKLTKAAKRKLKASEARKGTAKITVIAKDAAGNAVTQQLSVKLS